MSEAERALWRHLRADRLLGMKFRRQHPFEDYILDFVCLENKLVIEVDGGQYALQATYDEDRTKKLQAAGFCVLRFWNHEVLTERESVLEKIRLVARQLQDRAHSKPIPTPTLPLKGRGKAGAQGEEGE